VFILGKKTGDCARENVSGLICPVIVVVWTIVVESESDTVGECE
jgi:hypothetical protein